MARLSFGSQLGYSRFGGLAQLGVVATAPANTVAPAVTGTATVGQTLTTTNGTWTGTATITYTYQWQRAGVDIGSATASTYVLVDADYTAAVRCVVTGTNAVGNAAANSNATAAVARTYKQEVIADSPVAYWRLGEAVSSNAVDEISANNLVWTNTAGVTWAVAGALPSDANTAVTVSGTTNTPRGVVAAVPLAATDNFTIECWLKPGTQNDAVGAMVWCGNGTVGYGLVVDSSNHPRGFYNAGSGLTDAPVAALSTSVWSHVVLKRVSGVSKVFVNGAQADPGTNNTSTPSAPTTRTVVGGSRGDLANWFYKGSLDEVALYATALSDARILKHYNVGIA